MTVDQAKAFVAGFTEDCVVRFGDLAEFRGRAELEKLFRVRASRQKGYRLRKELKALMGEVIANTWEGEWEDSETEKKMSGYGVEIWHMRGGKIAVWEAAFDAKEAGKASAMGLFR